MDSQYTDKVVFIFLVPEEQEESFQAKLVESTSGRAVIRTDGEEMCIRDRYELVSQVVVMQPLRRER